MKIEAHFSNGVVHVVERDNPEEAHALAKAEIGYLANFWDRYGAKLLYVDVYRDAA